MQIFKLILWILLALGLTALNFGLDIAGWPEGTNARLALGSSVTYALVPYLIAALCMLSKKYRNPSSFFMIAAILSGLLAVSGFGNLPHSSP